MKLDFRGNKDFWAGVMFFGIGTGAMICAREYPFGTSLRMGPGYYPTLLGGLLLAFGLYVMLRGLRKNEKITGNWSIRALIVLPFSMALFGILIQLAGFIPTLIALCFVSAASSREFKFKEVLLLTVLMGVFSVAVFIWGLGLPYPLIKKF
jgi:hypothetical protein